MRAWSSNSTARSICQARRITAMRTFNTPNHPNSLPAFGYLRSSASGIQTPASPAWRSARCRISHVRN